MDGKIETAGNATDNGNGETGWDSVAAMADNFQANTPVTEAAPQPEIVSQPEKRLTADNNVYREIAKNALKNWNGLSDEEAAEKTSSATFEELEMNVGAKNSIHSAVRGICDALAKRNLLTKAEDDNDLLPEEDEWHKTVPALETSIFKQEKSDGAFKDLAEKLEKVEDKENFVLDVLSDIHKDWIEDNIRKLRDPSRMNKRYQAMPLELIGFQEAKSDLLFVEPILNASGLELDEQKLKDAYDAYGDIDTLRFKELAKDPRAVEELEKRKPVSMNSPEWKNTPELAMLVGGFCYEFTQYEEFGFDSPINYDNIEQSAKIQDVEKIPVPKKYVEEVGYYRDHYGTYEDAVRERDKAAYDASRGYTERVVLRDLTVGERHEVYWCEVAKQLVEKLEKQN